MKSDRRGIPDDCAVARTTLEVGELVWVQSSLVEAENIERDSPRLEERDHGLEFAAAAHQEASGIFPLLRDHKQDTVGLGLGRTREPGTIEKKGRREDPSIAFLNSAMVTATSAFQTCCSGALV